MRPEQIRKLVTRDGLKGIVPEGPEHSSQRRKGHGGQQLPKSEARNGRDEPKHAHIVYTRGQCSFDYGGNQICVYRGRLLDGMCPEHRQQTRKAPPRRVPPAPPGFYDHTAPWRCSLQGCERCEKKPLYNTYMKKRT